MRFDRFSEHVSRHVAHPWFFIVMCGAVLVWLPTLVGWDANGSDLLIDAISNPVSLLLLVLLHNKQHRADVALDARQDQLERSMALVLEHLAAREADPSRQGTLRKAAWQLIDNAERTKSLAHADLPPDGLQD
jgi:low affinity Fe/Cu permease